MKHQPSLPPKKKLRLLEQVDNLNRKLNLSFTYAQLAEIDGTNRQLSDARLDTIHKNLAGLTRFLKLPPATLQKLLLENPTLVRRSAPVIYTSITDVAAILGISKQRHLRNVLRYRRVVQVTPDRAETVIAALSEGLAIPRKQAIGMVNHYPNLLTSRPATIIRNVRDAAEALHVPYETYVTMVARMPGLAAHPPITLRRRIEAIAAIFNVDVAEAVTAMRKMPNLLALSSETIQDRVDRGAALLGVDPVAWAKVLFRRPRLIASKPETIRAVADETARLFGCESEEVIAIGLRHAAILSGSRSTMAAKQPLVLAICQALGFPYTAADTLRFCPLAYTYSQDHLGLRLTLARHSIGPRSIMNLLSLREDDAKALARRHKLAT